VRGDRDRHRGIDAGEFLDRDRVRERVAAGATPFLRKRNAHEAELGHLGDEVVGEAMLAVELVGNGRDAVPSELAHGAPDELVLFGEVEVNFFPPPRSAQGHPPENRCASSVSSRTP
jgi:hypothetical protein